MSAINVFIYKDSGSANATVTVKVNGSTKATGTFTTTGSMPTGNSNQRWVRAALSSPVTVISNDSVDVDIKTSSGVYHMQLMLWRDGGTTSSNHMQSFPYYGGSNRHQALVNGSPAWSNWAAHTTYMIYAEIQ
jgi:hypothetical protein